MSAAQPARAEHLILRLQGLTVLDAWTGPDVWCLLRQSIGLALW